MKLSSLFSTFSSPVIYFISIAVALLLSFFLPEKAASSFLIPFAEISSDIFMRFLSLISLPIIFFSIVSSATSGMASGAVKTMGKKIIFYTLLTTFLASGVALMVFLVINPVYDLSSAVMAGREIQQGSYLSYLLKAVPSNVLHPFMENNVCAALVLAILVAIAAWQLEEEPQKQLNALFSSLFQLFMKMTMLVTKVIPVALFSFTVLFVRDVQAGLDVTTVGLYLTCVMVSNAIQALVVIPLLLRSKGISPILLARAMFPALTLAFFTKSSNATVPTAVSSAIERAKMRPEVARFTLPLCTSINMNACAAFILTTTLFVSMSYGVHFSFPELLLWVFMSAVSAVGNAGVPMGCYFLSSAFLAAMGVPLQLMGIILPFYAIIDAFETAINVWSDASCAMMVNKELVNTELVDKDLVNTELVNKEISYEAREDKKHNHVDASFVQMGTS